MWCNHLKALKTASGISSQDMYKQTAAKPSFNTETILACVSTPENHNLIYKGHNEEAV
jgi:hypothetical protein